EIEYVPAQKVDPRECEVAGADHHRNEEIAKRRRDRGDEEEPHHDDAVHGEPPVVDGRLQQPFGRREIQTHQRRGGSAYEEEERHRREEEQRDALVIAREQPGADRIFRREIAWLAYRTRLDRRDALERGGAHRRVS